MPVSPTRSATSVARRTPALALLLASGLSVLALSACTSQRPLPQVRADAEHYYEIGQFERAEADFAEYLHRKPEANDVRLMLAKSQLASGKPAQAVDNLETALDVDPLNDEIVRTQAQALYASGDPEELTAFLSRVASERGRVSDYLLQAEYMQKIGHPDEARTALITAAKLDAGRSASVQMAIASFYRGLSDRENAVRRLRMAYFLAPENPDINRAIRELGEIPGPSFALAPTEMLEATTATVPTNAPGAGER